MEEAVQIQTAPAEGQKEFHFGVQVTVVTDVCVYAKDADEAQEKFTNAGETGGMRQFQQRELDRGYEVLGMIEGSLPPEAISAVH